MEAILLFFLNLKMVLEGRELGGPLGRTAVRPVLYRGFFGTFSAAFRGCNSPLSVFRIDSIAASS